MAGWQIRVNFGRWGESPSFDRWRLNRLLMFLTAIGEETYRRFPGLPSVLEGAAYELREDPDTCCPTCGRCGDGNDEYGDALAVLERGTAPCGPLAASLAGELRAQGMTDAQCATSSHHNGEREIVHVVTVQGGRVIDPSELVPRVTEVLR